MKEGIAIDIDVEGLVGILVDYYWYVKEIELGVVCGIMLFPMARTGSPAPRGPS